jgi:uncharacterized protein YhhL (DUF1145 family)
MAHDTKAGFLLFQFETIALVSHTLVRTALIDVSHPFSVAITTPIALTSIFLVLCRFLPLMAQSTFDERPVHLIGRARVRLPL